MSVSTAAEVSQEVPGTAPRPDPEHRLVLLAVALVVAAGAVLRFYTPSGLWLDEAQSVAIARLPVTHGLFGALREDGSPPLYYLLLHWWMHVFGSSDLAVRGLSEVLSLAALPLIFLAARGVADRRVATAAVVLTATNPWMLRYAGETRMYSLIVVLVLSGLLALQAVRRRPTGWRVLGLAVVSGALMLTHYWAFFLLAVAGAGLVVVGARRRLPWTAYAAGGVAGGAVFFLPWVPSFLFQLAHTGTPWAAAPSLNDIAQVPVQWNGMSTALTLVLWPVWLLGAFTARTAEPGLVRLGAPLAARLGAGVVAGTIAVAWVAAKVGSGAFVPRYTAVVVPLALLVAAFGTQTLPRRASAVVLVLAAVLSLGVAWHRDSQPRTEANDVAAALATYAKPGDTVAFCPDQVGPATARALAARHVTGLRTLTYPTAASPERVDWVDYDTRGATTRYPAFAAMLATSTPAPHRVFLVYEDGYLTYGKSCSGLATVLDQRFGVHTTVVAARPRFYEKMQLAEWPTAAG